MEKRQILNLITGNKNKLAEFQKIIPEQKFDLRNINVDLPEFQGEDIEIAKQKILLAFEKTQEPTITEDTSLCFNSLKGLPGPYIKWFLDRLGHDGLNRMLVGFEDKSAYAQCIIGFMSKELKEPLVFIGRTPGIIVQPRGPTNFGWDPIFQPDGYDQTYAEMQKETKNLISHRYKAIQKMLEYFQQIQSNQFEQQS